MVVEIDRSSLTRAWKRGGGTEVVYEFTPSVAVDPVTAVETAIAAANQAAGVEEGRGSMGTTPITTEKGTILGEVISEGDQDELLEWFDHLAASLASYGLSGGVSGARAARRPRWIEDAEQVGPVLTANVGLPVVLPGGRMPFDGEYVTHGELLGGLAERLAKWTIQGDVGFIQRGVGFSRIRAEDAGRAFAVAAPRDVTSLTWVAADRHGFRYLHLGGGGCFSAQSYSQEVSWGECLDELMSCVRAFGVKGHLELNSGGLET